MMKVKAGKIALFALVATLAACGDAAVAPHSSAPDADAVLGGGVVAALTTTDTIKFNINIDPNHSTYFNLGEGNSLTFPRGSICDPDHTTYGVTEWDKPCAVAKHPVVEHVSAWLDAQGHPRVDFTPNVRFVPSVLPTQWVVITFGDFAASLDPWYNILYCANGSTACYDESKTDLSLATTRNPVTGVVTRRIKHFSGYLVGAGDDGSGSSFNKTGTDAHQPSALRTPSKGRSGYILVSGHL
ncbi:MAG TPA: hypothetical protein VGM67_07795 [Gemmatimonadaceae bacterium]|jgi:hypothetical protein